MRTFVAGSLLLLAGLAGYFWFAREGLAFSPAQGDIRLFIVEQKSEIEPPASVSRRNKAELRMTSLLRSEVTALEDDVVELRSRALHSAVSEGGRTILDTDDVPDYSSRKANIASLLREGIVERVSRDGSLLESTFVDQDALLALMEENRLPEALRLLVQRDLSVLSAYQPQFPTGGLSKGMSWQTESREIAGQQLPALRYEVAHLDDETVTLTFGSLDGEPASATGEAASYSAHGFLELERHSGWPLRASARIVAGLENDGEYLRVTSNLTLEQAGRVPRLNSPILFFRAMASLHGMGVDTSEPWFKTYFLPPFGPAPAEESISKLSETLLWFGVDEVDGRGGLDAQLEEGALGQLQFQPVKAVRLLAADGSPVIDEVPVDPRFSFEGLINEPYNSETVKAPFVTSELTDEQLTAIDRMEIDVPVVVPDQLITVTFAPDETRKQVDELGMTLTAEEWTPGQFRLKIHRTDGFLPDDLPLISVIPTDAQGEPLPVYGLRMTHTLFESLRKPFLENRRDVESWSEEEDFAMVASRQIAVMPIHERYGDLMHELTSEQSEIAAVTVYLYTTRTLDQTFVARSAVSMLNGGEVVGERTLDDGILPELTLAPMNIEDVSLQGVPMNRLYVAPPGEDADRCQASVMGQPTYQGSPLTFAKQRYADQPGSTLVTEHGLSYFYDLGVDVQIDCVTRIELTTGPVESNADVTLIDPGTIEVSEALYQNLKWARERFNLQTMPLTGFNGDGAALAPLPPREASPDAEAPDGEGRRFRFWGEVRQIRYPSLVERETRQVSVQFPPLP